MANSDVSIENHFTLFLFRLNTRAASDWVSENVQPDAQFLGDALVVEPRYVRELAVGMIAGGLEVC
jgi:hypothetical protein